MFFVLKTFLTVDKSVNVGVYGLSRTRFRPISRNPQCLLIISNLKGLRKSYTPLNEMTMEN